MGINGENNAVVDPQRIITAEQISPSERAAIRRVQDSDYPYAQKDVDLLRLSDQDNATEAETDPNIEMQKVVAAAQSIAEAIAEDSGVVKAPVDGSGLQLDTEVGKPIITPLNGSTDGTVQVDMRNVPSQPATQEAPQVNPNYSETVNDLTGTDMPVQAGRDTEPSATEIPVYANIGDINNPQTWDIKPVVPQPVQPSISQAENQGPTTGQEKPGTSTDNSPKAFIRNMSNGQVYRNDALVKNKPVGAPENPPSAQNPIDASKFGLGF